MRHASAPLLGLVALASLAPQASRAQADRYARPPATSRFTVQKSISVPMRDGVV